ncbi:MAG: molecular chaperone DjlA, partial [Pelagibacterales bacterium]|nr:molecular chaperone DjlA [Pelagibacterales bacterium]
FAIAYADETLHHREEKMLIRISEIFNITKEDYNRIKKIYDNKNNSPHQNLKKFYELLNVSENDSLESIKKKYRDIIKEYHPDTIQGKGLPEEFINFANKKLVDFNEAYNEIKKHKEKTTL